MGKMNKFDLQTDVNQTAISMASPALTDIPANDTYVTDVTYTMNYKPEINPLLIELAFLCAGLKPPQINTACELGFGQGLSLNFHATGSTVSWFGNDFNKKHALFARELNTVSQSGCHISAQSFREFCARDDLPVFDFICLHGIWSWIDDPNRTIITDFIKRKLRDGGVVYMSYNALPGMTELLPMRKILTEHANLASQSNIDFVDRITNAIDFAESLLKTNPRFSTVYPNVVQRLDQIRDQPKNYLAHEYFNSEWKPFHFSDVSAEMVEAGLQFACSANLLDHFNAVYLNPEQLEFLSSIQDITMRENMRDFMINQQFRADYWVKGAKKLTTEQRNKRIRTLRVMLVKKSQSVRNDILTYMGPATFHTNLFEPIIAALSDHEPYSIASIEQAIKGSAIDFEQLVEIIALLVTKEDLVLVNSEAVIEQVSERCHRLNSYLLARSKMRDDVNYLLSPVSGGGVLVPNDEQLFLVALRRGLKKPSEWANYAWDVGYSNAGGILSGISGSTMPKSFEVELMKHVYEWAENKLPILYALGIR